MLLFSVSQSFSQATNNVFSLFSNVEIRIDTNSYLYVKNKIAIGGEVYLPFEFSKNDAVIELRLYRKAATPDGLKVIGSNDYLVQDSLKLINGQYYRARLKFNDLSNTEFAGIKFSTGSTDELFLPIYPYSHTYATIYPGEGDVFIGEEKSFEVVSNNMNNIVVDER